MIKIIEIQQVIDPYDPWYDHNLIIVKNEHDEVVFSRKYFDDDDRLEVDVDAETIARYMAEDFGCKVVKLPTEYLI